MNIKAIETVYNGYRFRSRLEARWAVFFDELGIPYEYEKEGYDLGEAGWYLPDFWLPTVGLRSNVERLGLWVEIKADKPTDEEDVKCGKLAGGTGKPVILFVGLPTPWNKRSSGDSRKATDNGYEFSDAGWDSCMSFMQCHNEACNYVKIEFEEGSYCYCPKCGSVCNDESKGLLLAYDLARQARFEYR